MTTNEDIIELIKAGANDQLEIFLANKPSLSEGKTEQGISLLMLAAYYRNSKATELIKKHRQQLDVFEAASTGEVATVKEMINKFPDLVNKASVDGFSPLGLSCFFGHYETAKLLIEHGADVNLASDNSFKVTPIHSACATSDYAITELLLTSGANPNARQQANVTPLHEAAHNGKTALAELLIKYKAEVNAKTENGQTPLAMAREKSFAETALLIEQHGGR